MILNNDATGILAALTNKDISATDLMAQTLDRIDTVNPAVNAIVAMRPADELMAEAKAADTTPPKGPLHGLPIAIKDLAETKSVRTTYGSPIFADNIPVADSLMVARIRAAGAIIIGKTNKPEFGLGSHSFNPVYGTTCNPYDTSRRRWFQRRRGGGAGHADAGVGRWLGYDGITAQSGGVEQCLRVQTLLRDGAK